MIGTKILEERQSKFNGHLRVLKTLGLGIYIQANGLTQSGGIVESIWKSTLNKIRDSGFKIQDVLILGLGGGTVAKLIKKHWSDSKITGIEIDPLMVDLGGKYLGLNQMGAEIKIADALDFVSAHSLLPVRYDLIVVDLYNGDKYPKKFETENYIRLVRTVLASGGVVIFNRLYYSEKRSDAVKFGLKLQKIFKEVEYFYPEANLMFFCYN